MNVELIFGLSGEQKITCSTYDCGFCFGFSFFMEEMEETVKECGAPTKELSLKSTHRDVIARGYNTTEEEIEHALAVLMRLV
jgi:hypothetical protein